jgi:hypothetical protein
MLGRMAKPPYLYYVINDKNMNNENTFKNFSASKMSYNPKFEVIVTYTDFMGKVHNIVCKSRPALKKANEFLKMFKTESVKINKILSEYPVKMGKFPKKFHSEIKSELTANGFGSVSNYLIIK